MNKMICEKLDSIEACELYTRNSLQNQSVFSPTHAQLQQRTAVQHQCDICTKSFTRSSDCCGLVESNYRVIISAEI